jgi:hypothetical protein
MTQLFSCRRALAFDSCQGPFLLTNQSFSSARPSRGRQSLELQGSIQTFVSFLPAHMQGCAIPTSQRVGLSSFTSTRSLTPPESIRRRDDLRNLLKKPSEVSPPLRSLRDLTRIRTRRVSPASQRYRDCLRLRLTGPAVLRSISLIFPASTDQLIMACDTRSVHLSRIYSFTSNSTEFDWNYHSIRSAAFVS